MKKSFIISLAMALLLYGCDQKQGRIAEKADLSKLNEGPQIVHQDAAQIPSNKEEITDLDTLMSFHNDEMGLDIRTKNLSALDLRNIDLTDATFNLQTEWTDKLPVAFIPKKVLETGKNPGLGVRNLHEQGITGKGISVAIIDQNLLINHNEYRERIQLYEKNNSYGESTSMHGPAVTSILCGESVGVAPEVNVYYISESFADCEADGNNCTTNLDHMVESIDRVIEINEALPEHQKIKVLSISRGFRMDEDEKVYEAIERAKAKGIFVVTVSLESNYGINLISGYRAYDADPDNVSSYLLPKHLMNPLASYYGNGAKSLIIPSYHRTTAGMYGMDDYTHFATGSGSWTVPWFAGMYALCVQVDPNLTGESFMEYAMSTGYQMDMSFVYDPEDNADTVLINPEKLIEVVRANKH